MSAKLYRVWSENSKERWVCETDWMTAGKCRAYMRNRPYTCIVMTKAKDEADLLAKLRRHKYSNESTDVCSKLDADTGGGK
jgi:hypothetical protein